MFPKALAVHKQCHDCKLQQWSCEFVNPKQTTRTNPTTTNPETKTQSTPKPTSTQHPHTRSQYGGTWNRESETYKPAILTRRCSPPANSPHRYQPLCNFNPPEKAPNSQISSTDQFISSFSSLFIFFTNQRLERNWWNFWGRTSDSTRSEFSVEHYAAADWKAQALTSLAVCKAKSHATGLGRRPTDLSVAKLLQRQEHRWVCHSSEWLDNHYPSTKTIKLILICDPGAAH